MVCVGAETAFAQFRQLAISQITPDTDLMRQPMQKTGLLQQRDVCRRAAHTLRNIADLPRVGIDRDLTIQRVTLLFPAVTSIGIVTILGALDFVRNAVHHVEGSDDGRLQPAVSVNRAVTISRAIIM